MNIFSELKFTIEDTGVGLSKEDQKGLFQDYSNLNKNYFSMNKDGSGLGLSICKKIVEKLGNNNIQCKSDRHLTQFSFSMFDYYKKPNDSQNIIKEDSLEINDSIDEVETVIVQIPKISKDIKNFK